MAAASLESYDVPEDLSDLPDVDNEQKLALPGSDANESNHNVLLFIISLSILIFIVIKRVESWQDISDWSKALLQRANNLRMKYATKTSVKFTALKNAHEDEELCEMGYKVKPRPRTKGHIETSQTAELDAPVEKGDASGAESASDTSKDGFADLDADCDASRGQYASEDEEAEICPDDSVSNIGMQRCSSRSNIHGVTNCTMSTILEDESVIEIPRGVLAIKLGDEDEDRFSEVHQDHLIRCQRPEEGDEIRVDLSCPKRPERTLATKSGSSGATGHLRQAQGKIKHLHASSNDHSHGCRVATAGSSGSSSKGKGKTVPSNAGMLNCKTLSRHSESRQSPRLQTTEAESVISFGCKDDATTLSSGRESSSTSTVSALSFGDDDDDDDDESAISISFGNECDKDSAVSMRYPKTFKTSASYSAADGRPKRRSQTKPSKSIHSLQDCDGARADHSQDDAFTLVGLYNPHQAADKGILVVGGGVLDGGKWQPTQPNKITTHARLTFEDH